MVVLCCVKILTDIGSGSQWQKKERKRSGLAVRDYNRFTDKPPLVPDSLNLRMLALNQMLIFIVC